MSPAPGKFTHLDDTGSARMVDVGGKSHTHRIAIAEAFVTVSHQLLEMIRQNNLTKGDAISTARIAGIQAAKNVSDLIPLCHPIPVDHIEIEITPENKPPSLVIRATVSTEWKTGVEMEALSAVSIAALTIYDMCKSVERGIVIGPVQLISKSGGRSGNWSSEDDMP